MITKYILLFFLSASLCLQANQYQDIYKLSTEKRTLTTEAMKLLKEHHIDPKKDPAYKKASAEAFKASQSYVKVKKEAPELKTLNAESSKALKAYMVAKGKEDKAQAMRHYQDALRKTQKKAATLPKVKKAQEEATKANKKASAIKLKLIEPLPGGKEYIEKIKILDKKIETIRKNL